MRIRRKEPGRVKFNQKLSSEIVGAPLSPLILGLRFHLLMTAILVPMLTSSLLIAVDWWLHSDPGRLTDTAISSLTGWGYAWGHALMGYLALSRRYTQHNASALIRDFIFGGIFKFLLVGMIFLSVIALLPAYFRLYALIALLLTLLLSRVWLTLYLKYERRVLGF